MDMNTYGDHYPTFFRLEQDFAAHEFIVDSLEYMIPDLEPRCRRVEPLESCPNIKRQLEVNLGYIVARLRRPTTS